MQLQSSGWLVWGVLLGVSSCELPVPGAASRSPVTSSGENLPSYVEFPSSEWRGTQETVTGNASLSDATLHVLDESIERAETLRSAGASKKETPKGFGRKTTRLPRSLVLLRGLGIFLASLLCVGAVRFAVQRPVAPKGEVQLEIEAGLLPGEAAEDKGPGETPAHPDAETEKGRAELRERLEKARALLPAAKRLAKVVGTEVAQRVLNKVQQSLDETVAEESNDSRKLLECVESGLRGLRQLHEAALEQAEAIVQEDKATPAPSLLHASAEQNGAVLAASNAHEEAAYSLKVSLLSFEGNVNNLSLRMHVAHDRLCKGKVFEDEGDGKLLALAAHDLQCLRSTSEAKKRAVKVCRALDDSRLSAIKVVLSRNREEFFRQVQGNVELLEVSARLARHIGKTERHPDAPDSPAEGDAAAEADPAALDRLEGHLNEIETLRTEHLGAIQHLVNSSSLEAIFKANNEAMEGEAKLSALLAKCWEIANALPSPSGQLDSTSRDLLIKAARRAYDWSVSDSAALQRILEAVEDTLTAESSGVENNSARSKLYVSRTVMKQGTASIRAAARRAKARVEDTADLLRILAVTNNTRTAVDQLPKAVFNLISATKEKHKALLRLLSCSIVSFLEDDMQHSAAAAAHTAAHAFDPSEKDAQQMQRMQLEYEAVCRAAEEAKTLGETAEAAASMRALVEEMQELVYLNEREKLRL